MKLTIRPLTTFFILQAIIIMGSMGSIYDLGSGIAEYHSNKVLNDFITNKDLQQYKIQQYKIGTRKSFPLQNPLDNSIEVINATLRAVNTHAMVWVADDSWNVHVTKDDAQYVANQFTAFYPIMKELFGDPSDIDGDGSINVSILLANISNLAGYYSPSVAASTGLELLYLNHQAGIERVFDAVMIHEYFHMIHYRYDYRENSNLIREGLARLAEILMRLPARNRTASVDLFEDFSGLFSLNHWNWNVSSLEYTKAYLFFVYLYEQLGLDVIIEIMKQLNAHHLGDIATVLRAKFNYTFEDVFLDWITALYLDGASQTPSRFKIRSLNINMKPHYRVKNSTVINETIVDMGHRSYMLDSPIGGTWKIKISLKPSNSPLSTRYRVRMITWTNGSMNAKDFPAFTSTEAEWNLTTRSPALLLIARTDADSYELGPPSLSEYTINFTFEPNQKIFVDVNNTSVTIDEEYGTLILSGIKVVDNNGTILDSTRMKSAQMLLRPDPLRPLAIRAVPLWFDQNSNQWQSDLLSIKDLPSGEYFIEIYFDNNNSGIKETLPMILSKDNPAFWKKILKDDTNESQYQPSLDGLDLSLYEDDQYYLFKISLRQLDPILTTQYRDVNYIITMTEQGRNEPTWTIFQKSTNYLSSNVRLTWACYNRSPVSGCFNLEDPIILGNSIIYAIPATLFRLYYTPQVTIQFVIKNGTKIIDESPSIPLTFDFSPKIYRGNRNLTIDASVKGNIVSWMAAASRPHIYRIFVDNVLIQNGSWQSNQDVIFNLDKLSCRESLAKKQQSTVIIEFEDKFKRTARWVTVVHWTNLPSEKSCKTPPLTSDTPSSTTINAFTINSVIFIITIMTIFIKRSTRRKNRLHSQQ